MRVIGVVSQVRAFKSKDGLSTFRQCAIEGFPVSLPDGVNVQEGQVIDAQVLAGGVYNGAMQFTLVGLTTPKSA